MTTSGFCSATSSPRQELNQAGCRKSKASLWCAHPLNRRNDSKVDSKTLEAARFRSELGRSCGHSFELVACLCYIIRPLFLHLFGDNPLHTRPEKTQSAILIVIARKLVQRNEIPRPIFRSPSTPVWLGFPQIQERFFFFFLNLADDESLRVGNIGLTRFWSIVDLNR